MELNDEWSFGGNEIGYWHENDVNGRIFLKNDVINRWRHEKISHWWCEEISVRVEGMAVKGNTKE